MFESLSRSVQEIPVTLGLIVLHVVLYGLLLHTEPAFSAWLYDARTIDVLKKFGGQYSPLVWQGEYYRLVVSAFLHGSLLHLIFNNLALLSLGRVIERMVGSFYFLAIYGLALFAGNFATLLWTPPIAVSVGASGAIMGIAGALCVFLLCDIHNRYFVVRPFGKIFFFTLVALNLAAGEWFEFINNAAHLGGFLAGVGLGVFFWGRIPGSFLPRTIGVIGLVITVSSVVYLGQHGIQSEGKKMWHLHHGLQAFEKGKEALAQMHLQKAVEKGAGRVAIQYLGELYSQLHRWSEAAALYRRAVHEYPKAIELWLSYVTACTEAHLEKEAQAAFELVQKRFPEHYRQEPIRALFLAARHDEREAILLYQRLLEDDPYQVNYNNNLAWLLVTAREKQFRNLTLALKHAQIAVERTQHRIAAYLDTLATVYFAMGDTKKALELMERALHASDALMQMPNIQRQIHRFRQAGSPMPSRASTNIPM